MRLNRCSAWAIIVAVAGACGAVPAHAQLPPLPAGLSERGAAAGMVATLRAEIDRLAAQPPSVARDAALAYRRIAFDAVFHGIGAGPHAQAPCVSGIRLGCLRNEVDRVLASPDADAPRETIDARLAEFAQGAPQVGLDRARPQVEAGLDQAPQGARAAAGRHPGPQGIVVGAQTHAIALLQGHRGQLQGRVEGVIELGPAAQGAGLGGGRHASPAVDQDHQLLPALDLELAHGRRAAPGGGLPVHQARVVAVHVGPQGLEVTGEHAAPGRDGREHPQPSPTQPGDRPGHAPRRR